MGGVCGCGNKLSVGLLIAITTLMSYVSLLQSVQLSKLRNLQKNHIHTQRSSQDPKGRRFLSLPVQTLKTGMGLYNDDGVQATTSANEFGYVPTTKVKMFFMNLERSLSRRKQMQKTFGSWGDLQHITAIESHNVTTLGEHVSQSTLMAFADSRKSSHGELALCASALSAITESYKSGDEVMLLLEDDMSDVLVDYWQHSLDEVIADADERLPNWDVIQLHISAPNNRWIFHSWKFNLGRITFVPLPKPDIWGGGAQLFSRRGMERFIERFSDEDGKFDCTKEYKKAVKSLGTRKASKFFQCKADYIYFNQVELWNAFAKVPPMFSFDINEGSTGLRTNYVGTAAGAAGGAA
eukprot:Lankesteria_metandrocarpae@DN5041_c1_g1_i1.p1